MRRAPIGIVGLLVAACGAGGGPAATLGPAQTRAAPTIASAAPASTTAPPTAGPTPATLTTPSEAPAPTPAAAIPVDVGAAAAVTFKDGARAQVGVAATQKAAKCGATRPPDGSVFELVSVGYAVESGRIAYDPSQWTLRASTGELFAPRAGLDCLEGSLGSGSLAAGADAGGWITFEVPAAAAGLQVLFAIPGRTWRWAVDQ